MKQKTIFCLRTLCCMMLAPSASPPQVGNSGPTQRRFHVAATDVQSVPKSRGTISVHLVPAQNAQLKYQEGIARILERLYRDMGVAVSDRLILPRDINVFFRECKQANAFWNGREIVMCYEFMSSFSEAARKMYPDNPNLQAEFAVSNGFFFFLHELGHALIQVLRLPTTGREEDVADQIATLLLTAFRPVSDANQINKEVLYAAEFFFYMAQQSGQQNLPFWDEHSLNQQRFYDTLCLVYGSDPRSHSALVPKYLPEARAKRCPTEFAGLSRSMDRLLQPHWASGTTQPQLPPAQPWVPSPQVPSTAQAFRVGAFLIYPPQGSNVQQHSAFIEVRQFHRGLMMIAQIRPVSNLAPVPSADQVRMVMHNVNPAMQPIAPAVQMPKPAELSGFAVGQRYQQPDPSSSTGMISGLFIVHITPQGQAIALDVFSPATPGNQNLGRAVDEYAGILMNNLRAQ
jgi:hypothetical protein